MAELTTFEETMRQLRDEMVAPLQQQRDAADRREAELMEELRELRAGRRDVDRMLKALVPSEPPGPKRVRGNESNGYSNPGAPITPELLDAAAAYLRTAKFPDGFTQTMASDGYREAGLRPKISNATWRGLIGTLHDSGVIRYDRRAKQGAKFYKVVGK